MQNQRNIQRELWPVWLSQDHAGTQAGDGGHQP